MSLNNKEIRISSFKKGGGNLVSMDIELENPSDKEKWLIIPLPFNEELEEKILNYQGVSIFHFKEDRSIKYAEVLERGISLYGSGFGRVGFTGFLLSPRSKIKIKNFATRILEGKELNKVEVIVASMILSGTKPFPEVFPSPLILKNNAEIKNGGEKDIEWTKIFPEISPSLSPQQTPGILEIQVEKKYCIDLPKWQ